MSICFSDRIALGAKSGLHVRGLEPGKDVAIVGSDDIDEPGRS